MFKDPGSGAIAVHVLQNYSTEVFLQVYTRFAARYGHPKKMFIDAGTQLLKAAEQICISVADITHALNSKY